MYCIEQIESMLSCLECHVNSWEWPDRHITMVCKMAHPILWAPHKNEDYWPAKCMSVIENNSKTIVYFFGHNRMRAEVDVKNCLMYSRERPHQMEGKLQVITEHLQAAMKVNVFIVKL